MAAYFFSIVSSASLCAMELELQKPKDNGLVKKALLCGEIMKERGLPKDVTVLVIDKMYSMRMDTIYKKFDPFFNFNAGGYRSMRWYHNRETRYSHIDELAALSHIHKSCRKFWAIKPQTLFYFKDYQDEILSLLISRPGCFIHNEGRFHIVLTEQERIRCCLLPDEFQAILHEYSQSYDKL